MNRIVRVLAFTFGMVSAMLYSCGSSPAPPPVVTTPTCTRIVTVTTFALLDPQPPPLTTPEVTVPTEPKICLCSDNVVRSCQP
jgi:hypothetical protein